MSRVEFERANWNSPRITITWRMDVLCFTMWMRPIAHSTDASTPTNTDAMRRSWWCEWKVGERTCSNDSAKHSFRQIRRALSILWHFNRSNHFSNYHFHFRTTTSAQSTRTRLAGAVRVSSATKHTLLLGNTKRSHYPKGYDVVAVSSNATRAFSIIRMLDTKVKSVLLWTESTLFLYSHKD